MSVPVSMRVGPMASTVLVKKRYLLFYVFLVWISILPVLLEFWIYWHFLAKSGSIMFYILLPVLFFIQYVTMVFTSLFFAKICLLLVKVYHRPKEGIFLREPSNKDYRMWSLRNTIKRWPVWLAHKFPFPFLDNICFKMFGVKTSFSNSLFEGWVDTEFINFGENVVVGQAAIIQSAMILGDFFILKRTTIDDNVRLGVHSVIMPGTHIGKNCVLAAKSVTTVDQQLEEGWIYVGIPAKKYKKNHFFEDGLEDIIGNQQELDVKKLREKYEEIYLKQKHKDAGLLERIKIKQEQKDQELQRLEKSAKKKLEKKENPDKSES